MRFGSVCSGIEAASIAWMPLGWEAAWFAEVDRAASEVLAYRFPHITNHGDMTKLSAMVLAGEIEAPDILVGGTPCQAFSVAGRREGLADARGQLTLAFVDLADAIDRVRRLAGKQPCIIVWENVPGVLSDRTGAFSCFLAGIVGDDQPVEPGPRPERGRSSAHWTWDKAAGEHCTKWTDAGYVAGPERAAAWRVQDAQFHGLAQRRRRVFVVASAREDIDPAAILLEFDGVRRDSAPRREAGEGITHPVAPCLTSSGRGVERTGDTRGQDAVVAVIDDGVGTQRPAGVEGEYVPEVAHCLQTTSNDYSRADGFNAAVPTWWDGRDVSQTLDAVPHKGQTMPEKNRFPAVLQPVAYAIQERAVCVNPAAGPDADAVRADDCAYTLEARSVPQGVAYSVALRGRDGGGTAELGDEVAGALRASSGGGDKAHVLAPVAPAVCVTEPVTHTLKAEGFDASEDGTGRGQPIVPAFAINADCFDRSGEGAGGTAGERAGLGIDIELAYALRAKRPDAVMSQMAVRRLLPEECEILQGFPPGWTAVPTKPVTKANQHKARANPGRHFVEIDGVMWNLAADGPRYKQCGNSMATNVMHWIGRRIKAALPGDNGGPPLFDHADLIG